MHNLRYLLLLLDVVCRRRGRGRRGGEERSGRCDGCRRQMTLALLARRQVHGQLAAEHLVAIGVLVRAERRFT